MSLSPIVLAVAAIVVTIATLMFHSRRPVELRRERRPRFANAGPFAAITLFTLFIAPPAHASIFHGETLDMLADILAWVVLFIAPAVGIVVFWLVHILPEKIAEKKQHPQAKAIQTLCLLSLFFGGLLWPLAWLWAYSKPVFYKLAYGTDKVAHGHDDAAHQEPDESQGAELLRLRQRLAELESKQSGKSSTEGTKA